MTASSLDGSVGTGNRFLDALPAEDRERLMAAASREQLPLRRVLFRSDQKIDRVYFPLSGVVSLVTVMQNGGVIEMATIGREGIVGVPMVMDGRSITNAQAVSQIQGESLSMPADAFVSAIAGAHRTTALVNDYLQALFTLVGQNAACNRLHTITERCARWLLMARDRMDEDTFELTHEFLSQMVGSRRASVTEAAQTIQDAGAITYHRGVVEIHDRALLEGLACECYGVISRAFDGLYQT